MQHWCLGRRLSVHMDKNYGISKTIQERTNEATNVLLDKAGQDSRNISKVQDQFIYSDSFPSKLNQSVIVEHWTKREKPPCTEPTSSIQVWKQPYWTKCREPVPPGHVSLSYSLLTGCKNYFSLVKNKHGQKKKVLAVCNKEWTSSSFFGGIWGSRTWSWTQMLWAIVFS